MSIEIMSMRNSKISEKFDVRVDRTSVLGNPFKGERNSACDRYEEHFRSKFKSDDRFRSEVMRLIKIYREHGRLRLFCWCAPLRCHSEFIRKAILHIVKVQDERNAA